MKTTTFQLQTLKISFIPVPSFYYSQKFFTFQVKIYKLRMPPYNSVRVRLVRAVKVLKRL